MYRVYITGRGARTTSGSRQRASERAMGWHRVRLAGFQIGHTWPTEETRCEGRDGDGSGGWGEKKEKTHPAPSKTVNQPLPLAKNYRVSASLSANLLCLARNFAGRPSCTCARGFVYTGRSQRIRGRLSRLPSSSPQPSTRSWVLAESRTTTCVCVTVFTFLTRFLKIPWPWTTLYTTGA